MVKSDYLFHFIISGKTNTVINNLKIILNFSKNCDLFNYILEVISKIYPNLKQIIGDHQSEYEYIDIEDLSRIDKYVRIKTKNYKMLKKWHYLFNEYGMSAILRDIVQLFYEGVVKYGAEKFIALISRKLKVEKIKNDLKSSLTHMIKVSIKKRILYSTIIQNLLVYS